jgi:hypothetical protein
MVRVSPHLGLSSMWRLLGHIQTGESSRPGAVDSQCCPAAKMQVSPVGEVLTMVQLPLVTELNTSKRFPFD